MRNQILVGDCLSVLKTLPDESVHCCVTSPPYYGLRDYGTRRWFGGDPTCTHDERSEHGPHHPGQVEQTKWKNAEAAGKGQTATTESCIKCDAWWGQLGLEPTPALYVEHMVEVFQEVRRVLHPSGTLWLNIGDSYSNDGKWGGSSSGKHVAALHGNSGIGRGKKTTGLKPKDLIGIPWRLAFGLQDDGWWLRSDIIWSKPNPMPESITDRPTKAHEYIFLLTKNQHYFYDADAVKEPLANAYPLEGEQEGDRAGLLDPLGRNRRTVWTINTKPYKGAHFAVFPPELPELCIKAGTSERGCCPKCGAPQERIVELGTVTSRGGSDVGARATNLETISVLDQDISGAYNTGKMTAREHVTVGWKPTCKCGVGEPVPCVVLDPFAGSGTTLATAKSFGRDYLGIEINSEYAKLIEDRVCEPHDYQEKRAGFDLAMALDDE